MYVPKTVRRKVKSVWPDLPVIDALGDQRIFFDQDDFAGADKKDPANCVLAKCGRRIFGCTTALFFRTACYMDLPQEDGTRAVERFILDHKTRRFIENFDADNPTMPIGGLWLKKPKKSRRLVVMTKFNTKYNNIIKREAKKLNMTIAQYKRTHRPRRPKRSDLAIDVRSPAFKKKLTKPV